MPPALKPMSAFRLMIWASQDTSTIPTERMWAAIRQIEAAGGQAHSVFIPDDDTSDPLVFGSIEELEYAEQVGLGSGWVVPHLADRGY